MKYHVRLEPRANRDLDRLRDFLDEVAPEAARSAARAIRDGINGLAEYPTQGAAIGGGRRALMIPYGNSGYVVQYRVDPGVVVVVRIFHMREDR
ncbi:hypothetical protein BH10PSE1_BH10PSE1_26640 [soil metagenome]